MLEKIQAPAPLRMGADAGYGCEQNYEYLENKGIEAYVKYPGYYQEQTPKRQDDPFHSNNLYYNQEQDYYVCPMGQHLTLQRIVEEKTSSGYVQKVHLYQAQRCEGCPLRGRCHSAKTNRMLQVNHRAAAYRRKAKQRLRSLRGIAMRRQRGIDVESVFGHIKQCRHFRRFLLRGLNGVATETGLLAIAHNLKKWWVQQGLYGHIMPTPPAQAAQCAILEAKGFQLFPIFEKIRA